MICSLITIVLCLTCASYDITGELLSLVIVHVVFCLLPSHTVVDFVVSVV